MQRTQTQTQIEKVKQISGADHELWMQNLWFNARLTIKVKDANIMTYLSSIWPMWTNNAEDQAVNQQGYTELG